jgi:hypothetical protein
MWLYVNSFRLCVCVVTYLVETTKKVCVFCNNVAKHKQNLQKRK